MLEDRVCATVRPTGLDKRRNTSISEALQSYSTAEGIVQYETKWTNRVGRLAEGSALRYHPSGRRVLGRPKQRWQGQEHLKDKKEKV